jgi:prolyl-tRNA synthetase
MERISTPGAKTIQDLVDSLGINAAQTCKAVFFKADGKPIFVAIRGDLDVNEVKLKNALKAKDLAAMDDGAVRTAGLVAGSASAVGLRGMLIVADRSAVEASNLVAGANESDWHLKNVNHGRDWQADIVADIALAREGDSCATCGTPLEVKRGMEMGHVFKLGTMYSEAMGVEYENETGERKPVVMGCYGIGIERMLAAVLEANHDENGIVWPNQVAPFDVHVVALNMDQGPVAEAVASVEEQLRTAGLEVLTDDRPDSAGIKFKDADLLGMPVRLTISPRSLERGGAEMRLRKSTEMSIVPLEGLAEAVTRALRG